MVLINSAEFATHQDKYFNLAMDSEVHIKRGAGMFRLVYEPIIEEQPILEPDEDFYRAITMDEFKQKVLVMVDKLDKKYAKK
ncbi:MAG: hypothetical protein FWD02_03095 [Bacteroidales bacterium]|nr:hypothetical protein [Bacteroidales bacterium]